MVSDCNEGGNFMNKGEVYTEGTYNDWKLSRMVLRWERRSNPPDLADS